jgi:hypothetical protein
MAKRTKQQIDIDGALTKRIARYDGVDAKMAEYTRVLNAQFNKEDQPNMFFYVKGSVAVSRYLRNWGIDASRVNQYCARSDWDTQLVINPNLPVKEWLATFKQVETVLVHNLLRFEQDLRAVFSQIYFARPDANADHLREQMAAEFGNQLRATATAEGFDRADSPHYWNLRWDAIRGAQPKEILELGVQAHNRATLTWGLVHPGQTMVNLNSVLDAADFAGLSERALVKAGEAWEELEQANNRYEHLVLAVLGGNQAVPVLLQQKLATELTDAEFAAQLPLDIFAQTVVDLPEAQRDTATALAQTVRDREQELANAERFAQANPRSREAAEAVAHLSRERDNAMLAFTTQLVTFLDPHARARAELTQRCWGRLSRDPAWVTGFSGRHWSDVSKLLGEEDKQRISAAEDEYEQQLAAYREDPSPEDVAEADKQAVERFAPFTLVEQSKGNLKTGSVLENMTIRDFYLYRLMVRGQVASQMYPQVDDYEKFKQQFKFRAELLDVSVPRHDTLESAEQWAAVRDKITLDREGIPVPNGDYLLDEYMLIFREDLDSKSSSAHKAAKRLWRACLIAEAFAQELQAKDKRDSRIKAVSEQFPSLASLFAGWTPGVVIVMRMCEQLIDSYILSVNDRLRQDLDQTLKTFLPELMKIVTVPLTDVSFLALMKIFAQLGRSVYLHSVNLAAARRHFLPDKALGELAGRIQQEVAACFHGSAQVYRCTVVEDFAINAAPDLPTSLKESLPMQHVSIVIHTTNLGAAQLAGLPGRLSGLATELARHLPGAEMAARGQDLYLGIGMPALEPQSTRPAAKMPIAHIHAVINDDPATWIAPRHPYDVLGIIGHYRQTLAHYNEYQMQQQKKRVLRELEAAQTTF